MHFVKTTLFLITLLVTTIQYAANSYTTPPITRPTYHSTATISFKDYITQLIIINSRTLSFQSDTHKTEYRISKTNPNSWKATTTSFSNPHDKVETICDRNDIYHHDALVTKYGKVVNSKVAITDYPKQKQQTNRLQSTPAQVMQPTPPLATCHYADRLDLV